MKKLFITMLSIVIAILLVSCSSPISETDTTQKLTGTEMTAETTTAEETKITERVTDIAIETETTEEVTTTEEPGTESEKVDVAAIEVEIQKLWKIESTDKEISYSKVNFLFENGIILSGSENLFKHEFTRCGTYSISDFGELECTFFSLVYGTKSTCVYKISFDDTGESMTLYCESSDGLSYFAGREDDIDYTLTFKLTNYPSESKSHDARLKGDWATMKNQEITYLSLGYFNGFKFEARINGEMKRGTWTGYSGTLTLTFEDGSVATYTYELDSRVSVIRLLYGKEECCELDRMVPDY